MSKLTDNKEFLEKVKVWTSFYRANPHRFAHDYLGIKLKIFQMILIFMMDKVSFFMYLAARGQGKSWIIAVYAVIRACLYPMSEVVIASGTKNQARLIISEKIVKKLKRECPYLAKEIKEIKDSKDECVVLFHNGSTITAVVSNDNSRGYRGTTLIAEEFRMIKKEILDKVLRKFTTVPRQPKYLSKEEYKHLQEPNKELYISSSWYKNHWAWEKFNAFKTAMAKGRSYFVCGLPYELSIEEGLLSQEQVDNEMQEDDFDPIAWMMEMECLFFGESEKAFYKLSDFQNTRDLKKPFYPTSNIDYVSEKKKKSSLPRQSGEIRIISADVAMMGGDNDNTIYTCMRLLPKDNKYERFVPYIESLNGQHSETQAIRLKQLYHDFEADYVVMDTNGNGISLYDDCAKVLYDQERDIEYPAWCAMNNDEMKNRALDKNALPLIYSVKASSQFNHELATGFRSALQKNKLHLLVSEIEAKDILADKSGFNNLSNEDQARLLKPFIQTTMLVNETVNLEYEIRSGFIKVYETSGKRKDRFSSIAYGSYYADILEKKLNVSNEAEYDPEEDYVLY